MNVLYFITKVINGEKKEKRQKKIDEFHYKRYGGMMWLLNKTKKIILHYFFFFSERERERQREGERGRERKRVHEQETEGERERVLSRFHTQSRAKA